MENAKDELNSADTIQASDTIDKPKYEKVENIEEAELFKEELVIGERDLKYKPVKKIIQEDELEEFDFDVASLDFSLFDVEDTVEEVVEEEINDIPEESEDPLVEELEEVAEAVSAEQLEWRGFNTMNSFFTSQKTIVEAEAVEDSIVEESGIYVIPKDLKIKYNNIDEDFKSLVDSILR